MDDFNYTIAYYRPMLVILSRKQYDATHGPVWNADRSDYKLRFPPNISGWYKTAKEAQEDMPRIQAIIKSLGMH